MQTSSGGRSKRSYKPYLGSVDPELQLMTHRGLRSWPLLRAPPARPLLTMRTLAATTCWVHAASGGSSPGARGRPWPKQKLLRLVQGRTDPQTRELLLHSFVAQHAIRPPLVAEAQATVKALEALAAPLVDGQGTARQRQLLRDACDLLFDFEEGPLEPEEVWDLEALAASAVEPHSKPQPPSSTKGSTPQASPKAGDSSVWNGQQWNFEWRITDFSKQEENLLSPFHVLDGLQWQLQVYPKGNYAPDHLSAYVRFATDQPKARQRAEFRITLLNQLDPSRSLTKGPSVDTFEGKVGRGWTSFMPLEKLADKSEGWLVDDTLKVRAAGLGYLGSYFNFAGSKPSTPMQLVASVKRLVG